MRSALQEYSCFRHVAEKREPAGGIPLREGLGGASFQVLDYWLDGLRLAGCWGQAGANQDKGADAPSSHSRHGTVLIPGESERSLTGRASEWAPG